MKVMVVKEFTFDSAHFLPNHPGKCRNLHGHTYRLQVGIEGKPHQKTGMVIDFADLKNLVEKLLSNIDHRNLNEVDLPDFPSYLPTAENMVIGFVHYFENILQKNRRYAGMTLALIRLWETPSCYCEWCKKENNLTFERTNS